MILKDTIMTNIQEATNKVGSVTIHCGDSAEVLKQYPDNCFDSVVTDPPY